MSRVCVSRICLSIFFWKILLIDLQKSILIFSITNTYHTATKNILLAFKRCNKILRLSVCLRLVKARATVIQLQSVKDGFYLLYRPYPTLLYPQTPPSLHYLTHTHTHQILNLNTSCLTFNLLGQIYQEYRGWGEGEFGSEMVVWYHQRAYIEWPFWIWALLTRQRLSNFL